MNRISKKFIRDDLIKKINLNVYDKIYVARKAILLLDYISYNTRYLSNFYIVDTILDNIGNVKSTLLRILRTTELE